jgi:hypothetical protein
VIAVVAGVIRHCIFLLGGWWGGSSNGGEEKFWWLNLFAVTPSMKIVDEVEQPFGRVHLSSPPFLIGTKLPGRTSPPDRGS